jgi:hypothetical protein
MSNFRGIELDQAALDGVHGGGGLMDALLNFVNHVLGTEGKSPVRVTEQGISVSKDNIGKPPAGAQQPAKQPQQAPKK